ncbi:prolyl oligopeptidase family serine peptidase [Salegentibacter chungangensis]|uniref:prolyl oligopeptidase n=1 Tax=Salegentibacter chungangensis TaxID=1335724 RepID=A0ABW3NUH1_9FLAO
MKKLAFFIAFLVSTGLYAQKIAKPDAPPQKIVTDEYHGVKVEDPYRYMEDLKDPKVINWMKENTNYAEAVLNKIPGKEEMLAKMRELDGRTAARIYNLKMSDNDDYYYLLQKPEDEKGKLYYSKGYEGEEKLLFEPDNYKSDSDGSYSILGLFPDNEGEKIAIILAPDGSENGEMIILNRQGERLQDQLDLVDYVSWLKDDNSLVYTKLNSADLTDKNRQLNLKSYIHKLGDEQAKDKVVFSSANNSDLNIKPEEIPLVFYDKDADKLLGLVVTVNKALKLYMAEPGDMNNISWKQLTSADDKVEDFSLSSNHIYYKTFKNAPNFKIMMAGLDKPAFENAELLVDSPEEGPINDFEISRDGIFYVVKSNGVEAKVYFQPKGQQNAKQLELPFTAGSASLATKGSKFGDVWVTISGWTSPAKRYMYDPSTDNFKFQPLSTPAEYPELDDLVAKEVMVTSHDGVKVPVSILHKKGIKMDGSNPVMMYGYGSYGATIGPFFSPLLLAYTLYDGIFVVPHVRGGGELGDDWHRAGQKLNKPNTWKDAIAAAEYLIDEGYTSSEKLSIFGGSAGGIFVGRAITERPDLFGAASPQVGAMNTVRMEETPNGPVNAPEFGTVKDPEEFKGLLEMDSYLHIEDGTKYPATLVTGGMNDPRVSAWEPAKFAARLQAANASDEPILLLTDFGSGHGIGDTKTKRLENFANTFSFFYWQAGHPKFQPTQEMGSK